MATIYQKLAGDKTLILDPREYMLRQFDLGADWTEIRLGMFWTVVTAAGDNVDAVNEIVNLNSFLDWSAFGIKDSGTTNLPGQAGGLFLGLFGFSTGAVDNRISGGAFPKQIYGSTGQEGAAGYNGVTLKGALTAIGANYLDFPAASAANGYNAFTGVKFVIANRGLATQTVTISVANTAPVPGTDYSVNNLRTYLNNGVYGGGAPVVPWNDGVAAYTIPDAWFLRLPFFNNRIRLSAMEAVRYV